MFVRKSLAGIVTVALTGSVLALTAGSASAAYTPDPDDTTFTPVATDLIGVGSDTSQNALLRLANAYNAKTPAPTDKLATYAATGGNQIPLPGGTEINRPNGSGAGKALLYGAGNNTNIDFARSSSSLNATEVSNGLKQFPFALDTLGMAVSGQVASHAPAGGLTIQQIVSIYKGTITNWSEVGGTAGVIKPLIPQTGSGTRNFFQAQLDAANGSAVTLGPAVTAVQEHDPAPIQNDPDAIAPFSIGRAGLAGTILKIEPGFSANRALYNVVRGTDVGNADIQAIFGEEGFVCSEAARASIEAAGFKQLATADKNGVCGVQTDTATTDFTINTGPATTDDTDIVPTTSDVIGVGSDTSQHALYLLGESYNGATPAPTNELVTFAATGGGQIPLPSGAVNRPNGSGAGKALLYGAGNNTDVDFARSSSSLNPTEVSNGLKQFPFALDTLGMAVSGNVASHAPATLTIQNIVDIYKGTVTNWSQLGGTAGVIKPLIPQTGSGTRSFFQAQLDAANGSAVTLGPAVTAVQEHDPAPIQGDPDAIAPFSVGRAGLAGTALHVVPGFTANRALYNVVRGTDIAQADILAIFGPTGFVCSDAARDEILAAGFKQLDRVENGGVCGQQTDAATTNFETNDPVVTIDTTTDLTASNPSPFTLRLRAVVTGTSGTPTGTVEFTQGEESLGVVSLIGGVATKDIGKVPGSYPVVATYTPEEGTQFQPSEDSATGVVAKAKSTTTGSAKKSGSKYVATVKVVYKGSTAKVSGGKVTVKKGSVTVGTGTVKAGKVVITLQASKLKKGKNSLKAVWAGNALATGSTSSTFTVTKK